MLTQKLLVGEVQHAQRKKSSAAFKIIFLSQKKIYYCFSQGAKIKDFNICLSRLSEILLHVTNVYEICHEC